MRPKAESRLLQENERVIITEWRLRPGAETGWHRHGHDYVVVCLTAGTRDFAFIEIELK